MGKRIIFTLIVFLLIAAFFLPQVVANLDQFLLQQLNQGSLLSPEAIILDIGTSWSVILNSEKAVLIYLMATVCLALLLLILITKGSGVESRSKMQRITPDIVTPCADGQGQYGTARWMTRKEMHKVFLVWSVPMQNADLKALLKAGRADRKEIRHANIQLD